MLATVITVFKILVNALRAVVTVLKIIKSVTDIYAQRTVAIALKTMNCP